MPKQPKTCRAVPTNRGIEAKYRKAKTNAECPACVLLSRSTQRYTYIMNNRSKQGSREQHQDDLVFVKEVRNPHAKKSIQRDKQAKRERKFERKWN